MAAFRIPCLLWEPHPAERIGSDGELARYIIRASFSQERMQYLADEGNVIYSAKDGKDRKVFDAPEWLAAMCSHVPNRGEQMVRYYGWYSNVTRGKRQKSGEDAAVPHIIESDRSPAACRRSWARLIQKIYEVDPLMCQKCRGAMRIISSIEAQEVIKTILKFLGLWLIRSRPHAKAHAPPAREYATESSPARPSTPSSVAATRQSKTRAPSTSLVDPPLP